MKVRLDPTEGSEQAGTRPAIVVSPTFMNERSNVLLVAPITSRKVDRVFEFEVLLDHEACGLEVASKALMNQLRTIDKRRIVGGYGVVDSVTQQAIDFALEIAVGLVEL